MVSDEQVRLLRRKLMEKKTRSAAAAMAGMSRRSAQKWQQGPLPSEKPRRPHDWRSVPDAFADVWEPEVVPLLLGDQDGVLEAKTVLELLEERHPGKFGPRQLRTLQRRFRDWRALHGPGKEVFFEQQHVPGREGALDFTHGTELGVTIAGQLFTHLLFVFALSYSKWRWVGLALGETFEALVGGLQSALWALGACPAIVRSDNLSAATHELATGGRSLTRRFKAVLDHYRLESTRIEPGESHQNGVAEKSNDLVKSALVQALVVRGSRDFASVDDYERFVRDVVERKFNRHVATKLEEERPHLKPLPPEPVPSYTTFEADVRKWSTIHIAKKTYSVPSRLIGHTVEVRQHADVIEVYYQGRLTERMPRLRGQGEHRIDYRHVIWSLVRKPGAFARYRYREELFPSVTFRRAYDVLRGQRGERADVEYVRILHLAASTMEAIVEAALVSLLAEARLPDYAAVKGIAQPERPAIPEVQIAPPDLAVYDGLLQQGGVS
jgi:hypothetical protein